MQYLEYNLRRNARALLLLSISFVLFEARYGIGGGVVLFCIFMSGFYLGRHWGGE